MVDESVNHPTPGAPPPSHGSTVGTAATRCIILTGPNGSTPGDLLAGLSKRAVNSCVVAEPTEVMVELGQQRAGMLIVVDPSEQPVLLDLIEAVNRYHPRTVCWVYESNHASGKPQLVPFRNRTRPEPVKPQSAFEGVVSSPAPSIDSSSPFVRVQSQVPPERVRSLIVKVQGPAEVGEPLISEEELAMLLGPVPEEAEESTDTGGAGEQGGVG